MSLVKLRARPERVLLVQLDGKLPNLALMHIAAHYRDRGDDVELHHGANFGGLFDQEFDRVYASAIFEDTRPLVRRLLAAHPAAVVGGTGVDSTVTLASVGIATEAVDYSLYPTFRQSIGFSQRGCRLKCAFCVVPAKEGRVREARTVAELWRGDPWPARIITEEQAEAIASVDYRDSNMGERRLYTAWDCLQDEGRFFAGLEKLCRHGVRPRHLLVYMLIGYAPDETHRTRDERRRKLREFGALPYPMPFWRTRELVGFQRWVVGAYDKRVSWADWEAANYQPRQLQRLDESEATLCM